MANNIGYFIGGALLGSVIGAVGGIIITKRKCDKETAAQIEQMSAEIAKVDPYAPGNYNKMDKPVKMDVPEARVTSTGDVAIPTEEEITSAVREFKKVGGPGKVDYTAAYDGTSTEGKQESIFDLMKETDEVDDEEDEDDEISMDIHSRADLHSDPVVISADEAGDVPDNYESEVLYYYVQNDVLVDDYDDEITDPEKLVGNLLDVSGFKKNLDRHLYVKNPRISYIYEIQKVFKPWEGKEGGV